MPDLRKIPHVGYQRHAPPSPALRFRPPPRGPPVLPEIAELEPQEAPRAAPPAPAGLPKEIWLCILSNVIEVPALPCLMRIGRWFPDTLQTCDLWRGRHVRIGPLALEAFAPKLGSWLPVWCHVARLVVPKSQQLLAEIARLAPRLRVEVAWRFNEHLRGAGVEVLLGGWAARRTGSEELVVLGDAPLPTSSRSREPYLEVCLDERGEDIGDGVNDFGIGITACDPDELDELGSAAADVPRSWVVDFTQKRVALSVNNLEAARGRGALSSRHLKTGDRVGLRVATDGAFEVFLNGHMYERLVPSPQWRVPAGTRLFAVLDLWGRSAQISRTPNEEPLP